MLDDLREEDINYSFTAVPLPVGYKVEYKQKKTGERWLSPIVCAVFHQTTEQSNYKNIPIVETDLYVLNGDGWLTAHDAYDKEETYRILCPDGTVIYPHGDEGEWA